MTTSNELDATTRVDDGRGITRALVGSGRITSAADEVVPTRIDRFEIIERIGAGGMGVVYRARDPRLGRDVALKVVRADLPQADHVRLRREARALAALSHPHVVQVFEVGEDDGQLYITMEYVPGRTLRQWLGSAPAKTEVLARLVEAARGLAAAHAAGLLHRDIKPSNIYVGDDGRARLLDFGLARGLGDGEGPSTDRSTVGVHALPDPGLVDALTETGMVMGTPIYMAPEQLRGYPATPASDQFELCVTAYEALLDAHPFGGRPAVPEDGVLAVAPAPARMDPLAVRVRPLLLRGLSLEPASRWPSIATLVEAIERAVAPRRGLSWGASLLGAATVAGLVVAATTHREPELPVPAACAQGSSLAPLWSEERREALRTALVSSGVGYAADTAARVISALDTYASAWEAAHAEACAAATRPEPAPTVPFEARLACLERGRATLTAVLDVLDDPDVEVLARAGALLEGLDSPTRCNDVAYLRRQPARPADPAMLAAVTEVEPLVAELWALIHAVRYDRALELVKEADRAREAVDHPPLHAELDVGTGLLLAQIEHDAEAEPRLTRGFFLAQELGMDELAFEAALALVLVVAADGPGIDEGLEWVRHTEAMLAPQGDEIRRARLLGHRGMLFEQAARMTEALADLEQAVALVERTQTAPSHTLAEGLINLARVLSIQGRNQEAEAHLERVLAIQRELFGDRHPSLVPTTLNLGTTVGSLGRFEAALARYEEALALLESSGGRRQPLAVTVLFSMGNALRELGRHHDALARLEEAREISTAVQGPDHPVLSQIDNNLALVLKALGRHDEAIEAMRRALVRRSDAMGPDHPALLPPLVNLGGALMDLGRVDEAAPHLERALEISRGEGASDMDRAMTLIPAAHLARLQGRAGDAVARAEEAVRLFEQGESPVLTHASRARFELAQALVAAGRDRSRAVALVERARDDLAPQREVLPEAYAELEAWLAAQAGPSGAAPAAPAR